jgi:hypothetical protein
MAEMNTSFEELAHGKVRKRHDLSPVLPPRAFIPLKEHRSDPRDVSPPTAVTRVRGVTIDWPA